MNVCYAYIHTKAIYILYIQSDISYQILKIIAHLVYQLLCPYIWLLRIWYFLRNKSRQIFAVQYIVKNLMTKEYLNYSFGWHICLDLSSFDNKASSFRFSFVTCICCHSCCWQNLNTKKIIVSMTRAKPIKPNYLKRLNSRYFSSSLRFYTITICFDPSI